MKGVVEQVSELKTALKTGREDVRRTTACMTARELGCRPDTNIAVV